MSVITTQLHNFSYLKFSIVSLFAILLSACNPTAKFTISTNPAAVGETISFNASDSLVYKPEEGNMITKYEWDFGDGNYLQGELVEHSYDKAGKYTVSLTVTDAADNTHTQKEIVDVKDEAIISVDGYGGKLIGAVVEIDGVSATTNNKGIARIKVDKKESYKITAHIDGYVNQVINTPAEHLQNINMTLFPKFGETSTYKEYVISNIEKPQILTGSSVDIVLPENALINSDGSIATGKAFFKTVDIALKKSPSSYLGHGNAIDSEGNSVDLLMGGITKIEFTDLEGKPLELAKNKKITINASLYYRSIFGEKTEPGKTVSTWRFDETKGVWLEYGEGTVTVRDNLYKISYMTDQLSSIFSWSSEYKNVGKTKVTCVNSDDVPVACNIYTKAPLSDNYIFHKHSYVPSEGKEIVNLPTEGEVTFYAKNAQGIAGYKKSELGKEITIKLNSPLNNYILKCSLADGSQTACSASMLAAKDKDLLDVRFNFFSVPKKGLFVQSTLNDFHEYTWNAFEAEPSLTRIIYRGSHYSQTLPNGELNIMLDRDTKYYPNNNFVIACNEVANDGSQIDQCSLEVGIKNSPNTTDRRRFRDLKSGVGQMVVFNHSLNDEYIIYIKAQSTSENGCKYELNEEIDYKRIPIEDISLTLEKSC